MSYDEDIAVLCVSHTQSCDYPDAWVWISRLVVEIPGGRDGISHIFKHYLYNMHRHNGSITRYLCEKKVVSSIKHMQINVIWLFVLEKYKKNFKKYNISCTYKRYIMYHAHMNA